MRHLWFVCALAAIVLGFGFSLLMHQNAGVPFGVLAIGFAVVDLWVNRDRDTEG